MSDGESNLFDTDEMTPLQERLEKMAGAFGKWGYFSGFVIFMAMSLFLVCKIIFSETEFLSYDVLYKFLTLIIVCITVIIVAVPEGLPMSVTIAMAFSVTHMKKDQLLMKKMQACETMGSVSEICTGKTATLTTNDMNVKVFYTAGQYMDVE